MDLARMQDIGGCRAVLDDVGELRQVQRRLEAGNGFVKVTDYIMNPRDSGYRGVHVIMEYSDRDTTSLRRIEVQLRTRVMHDWAIAVEQLSSRMGGDLKSGIGPQEVLTWLSLVSEAMAIEETGETVPAALVGRLDLARAAAGQYVGRAES